jgi:soluble lytic murein transglycosylase
MRAAAAALALAALLAPPAARAQSPIWRAIQAQNFTAADALARRAADPLAVKLVRYARLLAPGQATAQDIGDFIADNPTWPQLALLRHRLNEAVTAIADDTAARAVCEAYVPSGDAALLRCAAAERAGGHTDQALTLARQAWLAGLASEPAETAFLRDWPTAADPATDWKRFSALLWTNAQAAERQAARLDAARQPLAAALVAFRRNDPAAPDRLAALSPAQQNDPILLLEQCIWHRARDDQAAALALWRAKTDAAEPNAPPDHRAAFWTERERLARQLLTTGDNDGAYFLADDTHVGPDQAPDAFFLAGWIALRKLQKPALATAHFQALATVASTVISQGRAYYWLGRAAPNDAAAKIAYARAAAFPTSYYGQLAAARLDGNLAARIRALAEPEPVPAAAAAFDAAELPHAASLLAAWGDIADLRRFLLRQALNTPDLTTQLLTARRALALGVPDVAVAVARLAGKAGIALPREGWPAPYTPPEPDPALSLGVMRQESSFDPTVVSGAGAIGLMQLLPGTARQIDPALGPPAMALTDPATNMRIGSAYLKTLLDQFNGVRPYALAAYNAGPRHVRAWIADNGDAATAPDPDAMVDWIEQIPFNETRNYVQRVLEGTAIYAATAP